MNSILQRVDEMCAANRITRVDVLCALVRAVIEGQPGQPQPALVPELRAPEDTRARAEVAISRVMRSLHRCTVRELKQSTSSKRIPPIEWDKALKALCEAGVLRVTQEPGARGRGQTRRVVTLLDGAVL